MDAAPRPGVLSHVRLERPLVIAAGAVACLLAVGGGLLTATTIADGHGLIIVCGVVLLVPVILWRYEEAVVLLIVTGAALVEQFPVLLGPDNVTDGTSTIPLFSSLSSGTGLSGVTFNPIEILLVLALVIWIFRAAVVHELRTPRSQLSRSLGILMGIVAVGYVVGFAHGGDFRASLIEVRPWLYLGLTFVLAARLLRTRRALDALLWALVLCAGVKALQGVYLMYKTHGLEPAPEALLGHEDSLFFGIAIMITLGLWLFGIKGRLRATATALLPLVLLADVGNHRRAAWAIAFAGVAVMLIVAYVRLPERRHGIRVFVVMCLAVGAVYLPAFWHDEGNLGQPARAVRTLVDPSARDQGSDQYRTAEDQNLGINIKQFAPFGAGFGVPINYVVPIVDISQTDSLILYVPHDGILYVWMRLGWQGMIAFWAFIASVVFAAVRLSKVADPFVAMLGTVAIAATFGYVILAYEDMGLFWYRVAFIMGALIGAVEAASKLPVPAPKRVPSTPKVKTAGSAARPPIARRRAAA